MARGDAEHAAQHQHGVQVKETGVADSVVTSARVDALEARVKKLEDDLAKAREAKKSEVPPKSKVA